MRKILQCGGLILLTLFYTPGSIAQSFTDGMVWEMGVGVLGLNTPLYPGSSDNANFVIPFPYLRLESKYLDVDRGIQGKLFKTSRLRFSVSGDLDVPVKSDDDTVRRGMPNLDLVLQLGPSLDVIFNANEIKKREFRLELPLRLALATDGYSTRNTGWMFEPRLSYEAKRLNRTGWSYEFLAGFRFATDKYHNYYYEVAPQYATPERPQYSTSGGYSGAFTELVASWRRRDLIYFAWTRYQNIGNAVYADSPLVEKNDYFLVGVGLNWIFAESL
jgi:outer membrane scaffolding protein for murein synthesis (MipA/OmpV family)